MSALLHAIGSLLVLPYAALALFFLFIGEVARAKGPIGVLDAALFHANWLLFWGLAAFVLLWVGLVVIGCLPRLQRLSALCLGLLAMVSFLVVVTLSSVPMRLGEVVFLLPCLAVVAISAARFVRAGPRL